MSNKRDFTTIIVITPKDFPRLVSQYKRLVSNIPSRDFVFVSGKGIEEELIKADLGNNVSYVDENSLLTFDKVRDCMQEHLSEILGNEPVPRGAVGWYYQQFLKMQYAFICEDEYYMTWDGDTIPCKPFSMFQAESDKPYLDLKHEYHALYFETLEKLLPGMRKVIGKSFISEHMLFNKDIMKSLISRIESNDSIPGKTYWEKIIHAIDPYRICDSGFSEFETYGTFVAFTAPDHYMLREWHSFRLGASFFSTDTICDRDYEWLGKDFFAISFEKNQTIREDNKNLFDNPEYQKKLSARKMLEIAQEEFNGGYIEVWNDNAAHGLDPLATSRSDATSTNVSSQNQNTDASPEDIIIANLGESKINTNINQAYLCYEQAHFICRDAERKKSHEEKLEKLRSDSNLTVRKTSICIVSYNCKQYMEECIRSIRFNCSPESYEIVITDNASTDGVTEYLRSLGNSIVLVESSENLGFPGGCNSCINNSKSDTDIFLLNNDTRMTHNALFWLRFALYENDSVGATGCMGSFAGNNQMINLNYKRVEDYMEYARANNTIMDNPYEEKCRLCGFAMLIRRDVLDSIGLLDENFAPGYFEDDDLSLRINEAGFRMFAVHNSFIYHKGSESFNSISDEQNEKQKRLNAIMQKNYEYTIKKHGYDNLTAAKIYDSELSVLSKVIQSGLKEFAFLEINCGSGNFLSMMKYYFPDAEIIGTSAINEEVDHAVKSVQIVQYNPHSDTLTGVDHHFDFVLVRAIPDTVGFITPEKTKELYEIIVKEGGSLLYITD